jgi:hypothetical protein
MKKIAEFREKYKAVRGMIDDRYYRTGRGKYLITQGVAPGAITGVLLLAVEYFRRGRYLLQGWWLVGYWALGLIVSLVLLCGGGTLAALYRWRKIERRASRLIRP